MASFVHTGDAAAGDAAARFWGAGYTPGTRQLRLGWDPTLPDLHKGPRWWRVWFFVACFSSKCRSWLSGARMERSNINTILQRGWRRSAAPGQQPALCNTEFFPSPSGKIEDGRGVRSACMGHRARTSRCPGTRGATTAEPRKIQPCCRCTELPKQPCSNTGESLHHWVWKLKKCPKIRSRGMCSGSGMGRTDEQLLV